MLIISKLAGPNLAAGGVQECQPHNASACKGTVAACIIPKWCTSALGPLCVWLASAVLGAASVLGLSRWLAALREVTAWPHKPHNTALLRETEIRSDQACNCLQH